MLLPQRLKFTLRLRCRYKILKNKKLKPCNKNCRAIFCWPHWKEYAKKKWKKYAIIGSIIASCFTLYGWYKTIKEDTKTAHQKFIDENYIPGMLIIPPNNNNEITIQSGRSTKYTEDINSPDLMNNGVTIVNAACYGLNTDGKETFDHQNTSFSIKVKNNTLLLSFIIRDLKTEEIICQVKDNKWLIKKAVYDYNEGEKYLEILDKYGYVAFSLWVENNSVVEYRGYFTGNLCTTFCDGNSVVWALKSDPLYERKCIEYAQRLKPHFIK